ILIMLGLGILGVLLTQPTPKVKLKEDLMVHDYVILQSLELCANHEGLHYIVPIPTVPYDGGWGSSHCEDIYRVRCQDQTLHEINTGASGACFDGVSHMQWEETMANRTDK